MHIFHNFFEFLNFVLNLSCVVGFGGDAVVPNISHFNLLIIWSCMCTCLGGVSVIYFCLFILCLILLTMLVCLIWLGRNHVNFGNLSLSCLAIVSEDVFRVQYINFYILFGLLSQLLIRWLILWVCSHILFILWNFDYINPINKLHL